jgi:hypothetical protein
MSEPATQPTPEVDQLESDVDEAIALCDGDVRAALRAALVYNDFLERKLDMMRGMVSTGFTRGKCHRHGRRVRSWTSGGDTRPAKFSKTRPPTEAVYLNLMVKSSFPVSSETVIVRSGPL